MLFQNFIDQNEKPPTTILMKNFKLSFTKRDLYKIFMYRKLQNLYNCFSVKKKYINTIDTIRHLLLQIKCMSMRNRYVEIRKLIYNTLNQVQTSRSEIKYFIKLLKMK